MTCWPTIALLSILQWVLVIMADMCILAGLHSNNRTSYALLQLLSLAYLMEEIVVLHHK